VKIFAPYFTGSYMQPSTHTFMYEGGLGLTLATDNNLDIALIDREHSNAKMIICKPTSSVELYYNNSKKLETVNDGVQVTGLMHGTATTARYADLAEKYTIADVEQNVVPGDVILIAQDENYDGEVSNEIGSNRILGVVSENPAFRMNEDLENGYYIALKGRISCYVQGPVRKGEPLITYIGGRAISYKKLETADTFGRLLGRANETIKEEVVKLIEIII